MKCTKSKQPHQKNRNIECQKKDSLPFEEVEEEVEEDVEHGGGERRERC